MKQMNKLITGVVTLATVVTLSACQSSHNNTKLVSMKGDTITVSDFYNETKNTELAQKAMLSLVISRVFETQYANKVSDKEVEKAYKQTADQYGTSFKTVLAQSGLTPETYKKQIRLTKLVEYAVKEQAKNETISKKDYRQAYDAYTPTMTTEIMQFEKEEDAKAALEAVKAEGADFAAIAKEKTIAADKKITYTFDSGETTLP
ncbi:TPA: foldase PrsA, partial [Streptococcus pyogenes]